MGLDISLSKIDKNEFEKLTQNLNDNAQWHAIFAKRLELSTFHKCEEVFEILNRVTDTYSPCKFILVSKSNLGFAQCLAANREDWRDDKERNKFIDDIDRILNETDFEKDVILYDWVS